MNRTFTSAFALAIVLSGAVALSTSARADGDEGKNNKDKAVCYKVLYQKGNSRWAYDTKDRLFLNILKHSDLTKDETAYSVHGKFIDVSDYGRYHKKSTTNMNVATGTVVTKSHSYSGYDDKSETGARLGVETAGGLYKTTNHTFDCSNSDDKATPDSWEKCALDGYEGYSLATADRGDDSCNFFQDGSGGDDNHHY